MALASDKFSKVRSPEMKYGSDREDVTSHLLMGAEWDRRSVSAGGNLGIFGFASAGPACA